jgi:hypothetical protein
MRMEAGFVKPFQKGFLHPCIRIRGDAFAGAAERHLLVGKCHDMAPERRATGSPRLFSVHFLHFLFNKSVRMPYHGPHDLVFGNKKAGPCEQCGGVIAGLSHALAGP